MPQWAGSCWYYLRYLDNKNGQELVSREKEKEWMPVDLYVGGAEHAVLHLLYSRFWHKFLYDIGVVSTIEPFHKLRNIGLVLAGDGTKMSKSKGNVITPDEIIEQFGADTLRLYEMFMGPFDQAIQWNEQGVRGVNRFLNKLWDIIMESKENQESSAEVMAYVQMIKAKVSREVERTRVNTPVAFFMEFLNFISERKSDLGLPEIERLLVIFAPFAPHFSEEMWNILGHEKSILREKWPEADQGIIKEEKTTIVVQIDGKLRDRLVVSAGASQDEVVELAEESPKSQKWLQGKKIKDIFFVQDKLINIITE